jgi:hypothetical protein
VNSRTIAIDDFQRVGRATKFLHDLTKPLEWLDASPLFV